MEDKIDAAIERLLTELRSGTINFDDLAKQAIKDLIATETTNARIDEQKQVRDFIDQSKSDFHDTCIELSLANKNRLAELQEMLK